MIYQCVFIGLGICFLSVNAGHFYGGFITAYPKTENYSTIDVEFSVSVSYTRSYFSNCTGLSNCYSYFCNQSTIDNQQYIASVNNLRCQVGCYQQNQIVGTTLGKCKAFSISNDWSMSENRFVFQIPKTSHYEISFTGKYWKTLKYNTPNVSLGNWEIRLKIDSRIRLDTKRMNISPLTFVVPVLVLSLRTVYTMKVPTYDADGDVVKCRWGNYSRGECSCKYQLN